MRYLLSFVVLLTLAVAQTALPQPQKFTVTGSYGHGLGVPACTPGGYGFKRECTLEVYLTTKDSAGHDIYTKYVIACAEKRDGTPSACANLVPKESWMFAFVDDPYCGVGSKPGEVNFIWTGAQYITGPMPKGGSYLLGSDGKKYPIYCIELVGASPKLKYTFMKESDSWCLFGKEFCGK